MRIGGPDGAAPTVVEATRASVSTLAAKAAKDRRSIDMATSS
jgi:hypothetical protein